MAYARLFSPYNDIDIFVEDSSYVGIYEKIFKKFLPEEIKLNKVIPLGPKNIVEENALKYENDNSRVRLYITDGDFDLLSKYKKRNIKNLYSLGVYSLENLLCEPLSIEEYSAFACPSKTSDDISRLVNIEDLIRNIDVLLPYIMALSIARHLKLYSSVYSINPKSVTKTHDKNKYMMACKIKVYSRVREIISAIVKSKGWKSYLKSKRIIKKNYKRRDINSIKIVPGKNFTIPYINDRVAKFGGIGNNLKIVSSYLAQNCTLENDQNLKKKLMSINKHK
nr:DUF4435 domain-containing protein [uncultured Neokomagataea sp.]